MTTIRCSECLSALERGDTPCDTCGSTNRELFVDEAVGTSDGLALDERHGDPGTVRPHRETSQRRLWNHDRQRYEVRTIVVDRDRNTYEQVWRHDPSGEEWTKKGALDDPEMHGRSARRGKSGDPGIVN